ncbi:unnamed protein product, partial [Prorocentrum cordatum]
AEEAERRLVRGSRGRRRAALAALVGREAAEARAQRLLLRDPRGTEVVREHHPRSHHAQRTVDLRGHRVEQRRARGGGRQSPSGAVLGGSRERVLHLLRVGG